MRYVVVTVNEGGADFDEYKTVEDLINGFGWRESTWMSKETIRDTKDEVRKAVLGDEITLDGCSTCFVLR